MHCVSRVVLVICAFGRICASSAEEECNRSEFLSYVGQIGDFSQDNTLIHAGTTEELREECKKQLKIIDHVKQFFKRCMKTEDMQVLQVTTAGKEKLTKEICHEGSNINKKYIAHAHCLRKIKNETAYCEMQFKTSQSLISSEIKNARELLFYSCCAFQWYKECKVRAANSHCGSDAVILSEYMSVTLEGEVSNTLCEDSYHSCYGVLYGVQTGRGSMNVLSTYYIPFAVLLCFPSLLCAHWSLPLYQFTSF